MSQPFIDESQLVDAGISIPNARALARIVNGNDLTPIYGSGSPAGVVAANKLGLYIDEDVPAIYYSKVVESTDDWILI